MILGPREILEKLQAVRDSLATKDPFLVPPLCFIEMGGRFLEYVDGVLRAEFPFDPRFSNPVGVFQGGMLVAAVDNVLGPLAYLETGTHCATVDLNVAFLRPFAAQDKAMVVEARILSQTRRVLFMTGKATRPDGKALAQISAQFLRPEPRPTS